MSNQTRLQAPEADFAGYEKNSRARVHRRYAKLDLSDHTSLPTEKARPAASPVQL
jgi:hypothetical protein